jgi:hypothetical protein
VESLNTQEKPTLWDSIQNYQRRNPKSINPPSERIDPDVPGAHFWVILVTNWDKLHPLIQDVLTVWYKVVNTQKDNGVEQLDPSSTEALMKRLELLDDKLRSFEIERGNLEEELSIRDRDFKRLRAITGQREKKNIEVQQELGKSFQEKIIQKQQKIEEQNELINKLQEQIITLEEELQTVKPEKIAIEQNWQEIVTKKDEEIISLQSTISDLQEEINNLKEEINIRDEKIKQIRGLFKQ